MKEDQGVPVNEEILAREREQARRYTLADFVTEATLIRVGKITISYGNDGFQCSCQIFRDYDTCRHMIALSTLIPSFPSLDLQALADGFSATKEGQDA